MMCNLGIRLPSFVIIMLYLFLSVYSIYYVSSLNANQNVHEINELERMKIVREYLRKINKSAKKTIKSLHGDLIDCVLFHEQPAFNHPLLKGKISKVPPSFNSTDPHPFQMWNKNGETCPEGTVPIRRITEDYVLRATQIERFRMKHNRFSNDDPSTHEYAVARSPVGVYTRSKAGLNVWAPYVQQTGETSISQLWVLAGVGTEYLNVLEAGWHVLPELYGDNRTRFFTFWTSANYRNGCYNVDPSCPGFIQTHSSFHPGVLLPDALISHYDGHQRVLTLSIERDGDGDWVLSMHSSRGPTQLGYWPAGILTLLRGPATKLEFGGEIKNLKRRGLHTQTQMGSGHFPREGWRRAAYVEKIEFDGQSSALSLYATHPNCYDVSPTGRPELGLSFFYGGPGRGPQCP